ncbi:hypothetical protein ACTOWA_00120 [Herbaspirillum seropedicae]|uniref:hypothetical protein n=1 Tax=Herbaspirillum seropedicae TaxID=964 RepID=UPI00286391F1|nr:hypothetical protein [Herbaspirillum seropedicae]MDR6398007.1 hypothetical protein [Herbaspirillum seropedicae]
MKTLLTLVKKFGFAEWLCVLFMASSAALWVFSALPASASAKEQLFAAAGSNEEAQEMLDCELYGGKYLSNGDIPRLHAEVGKILAGAGDAGDLSSLIPGRDAPAADTLAPLAAARYNATDSLEGAVRWILLEVRAHVVPVFGSLFALVLIVGSRLFRSR